MRLIGMVHLAALPGSPGFEGDRAGVRAAALRDAQAIADGGFDAIVVENFTDVPFMKGPVGSSVIAEMTVIVAEIRSAVAARIAVGVNVLRNDAVGALAIAAATGAGFVRVNVHVGSMETDQGRIEGDAARTLRERRGLPTDVRIFADVAVKHAQPPPGFDLHRAAVELVHRGLADGVIVTGSATGSAARLDDLRVVRAAVPDAKLIVGSGVTVDSIGELLEVADAAIVGTALKERGDVRRPVDPERVAELVKAATRQ